MARKRTLWLLIGVAGLFLASLLFNSGFRHTIGRRRAIRSAENELKNLTELANQKQSDINSLKNNPNATEALVRKELDYLRPGEKEVRFVKKKGETPPDK
jgi:cell division protein FtsB